MSQRTERGASVSRSLTRRLLTSPAGVFSVVVLVALAVCAVWPQGALPHDPKAATGERFQPPVFAGGTTDHLLGTDALGHDILAMLIAGARFTLLIVLSAGLIGLVLGVAAGLVAGYFRGWVDSLVMRLVDVLLSFPVLILVIAVVAAFGPSLRNLVLILGVVSSGPYARLVRGVVLSLRERGFVEAAVATGIPTGRIVRRHVLPNAMTSIVIFFTTELSALVLLEAALSFLGLGVQPPNPSWGAMIADGRQYLAMAWWVSALPGVVIVLCVLAFNFLGDKFRDLLDPALRER